MRTPEEICDALRRTCPLGEFVLDDNEAAIVMETAIREARAAALEEAAKVAEGFNKNRDWVPGSLYDTLRRETAAAIRALQEPEAGITASGPAEEERTG